MHKNASLTVALECRHNTHQQADKKLYERKDLWFCIPLALEHMRACGTGTEHQTHTSSLFQTKRKQNENKSKKMDETLKGKRKFYQSHHIYLLRKHKYNVNNNSLATGIALCATIKLSALVGSDTKPLHGHRRVPTYKHKKMSIEQYQAKRDMNSCICTTVHPSPHTFPYMFSPW